MNINPSNKHTIRINDYLLRLTPDKRFDPYHPSTAFAQWLDETLDPASFMGRLYPPSQMVKHVVSDTDCRLLWSDWIDSLPPEHQEYVELWIDYLRMPGGSDVAVTMARAV